MCRQKIRVMSRISTDSCLKLLVVNNYQISEKSFREFLQRSLAFDYIENGFHYSHASRSIPKFQKHTFFTNNPRYVSLHFFTCIKKKKQISRVFVSYITEIRSLGLEIFFTSEFLFDTISLFAYSVSVYMQNCFECDKNKFKCVRLN